MPVNNSQFHFGSVASLNSSHLDMNALLQKGKLSIGKHHYTVTLAKDGAVSVQRDLQTSNKLKNFFHSAKQQFTHKLLDNSQQSTSQRASAALSFQKRQQEGIRQTKTERNPPFKPDNRLEHRPPTRSTARPENTRPTRPDTRLNTKASRPDARTTANTQPRHQPSFGVTRPSTQSPAGQHTGRTSAPKLDLNHFVKAREQEAQYHGHQANPELAKEDYNLYLKAQKPRPTSSSAPASPPHSHNKVKDIMSYKAFHHMAISSANYHHESVSEAQIKRDYRQYKNEKMMTNETPSRTATRSASAPIKLHDYEALLASNANSKRRESSLSAGGADYHGYETEQAQHDQYLDEVDELTQKYLSGN